MIKVAGPRTFVRLEDESGKLVAYVGGPSEKDEERLARRFAAVDELVTAMIACLPDLEHYAATHGPGPDRRLATVRAALAAAGCEVKP